MQQRALVLDNPDQRIEEDVAQFVDGTRGLVDAARMIDHENVTSSAKTCEELVNLRREENDEKSCTKSRALGNRGGTIFGQEFGKLQLVVTYYDTARPTSLASSTN